MGQPETTTSSACDDPGLLSGVKATLEASCHPCHGKAGVTEGGFNYVSGDWRYTMIMPDGAIFGTRTPSASNTASAATWRGSASTTCISRRRAIGTLLETDGYDVVGIHSVL